MRAHHGGANRRVTVPPYFDQTDVFFKNGSCVEQQHEAIGQALEQKSKDDIPLSEFESGRERRFSNLKSYLK